MTPFSWLASRIALPLYRNAFALILSTVLTSVLGLVYWAIAARIYPTSDVGLGASLVSTMMFVSTASQLNLRSALFRYLPSAGSGAVRLVSISYLFIVVISALVAIVLSLIGALVGGLPAVVPSPSLVAIFVGSAVIWSLFSFQDHVLTSMRLTVWVPIENVIFAVVKIGLLVVMVGLHPFGVFVSWILAAVLGVATVSVGLFAVLRRRGRSLPPSSIEPGAVARFAAADYLSGIFSTAGTSLLPVLVLLQLGSVASAFFYVVWLITSMLRLVPISMFTSLMVEAANSEASFEREGRTMFRRVLLLVLVPVAVLVLAAPVPLAIFGADYADAGSMPLRLLSAAVVPYTVNAFASFYARLLGRMRLVILIEAWAAIPSLLVSATLMPVIGLTGIGIAVLVSQSVVALGLGLTLLREPLFGRLSPKGA